MVDSKAKTVGQTKLSAAQKAATTHEAAMEIIDAEVSAREKKTARLKELRKLHETAEQPAAPKPRRARPKKA